MGTRTTLDRRMAPETEAPEAVGGPPARKAGPPLQLGTHMLETFLSLMPDAAVAVDGHGTIVAVNIRTEAFFGYRAAELEGKSVELLVPERFRHAHRRQRSAYSDEPHARPMGAGLELYARRKDGTEFPVDISLAPIGGDQEQLVVAAVRDITERKAAQSAQAQLAAIVESSADAIFSMTASGVITSWNPAAEAMFGYERPTVVGHHISQFFPDDPVLEDLLDAARSGRQTLSHDTRWQRADGHMLDVAISVSLLDGSLDGGYSLLVRDITVRKAAELELQRQARWQQAAAEIRLSLLSDSSLEHSLDVVCKWAARLSRASATAIVVCQGGRCRMAGHWGDQEVLARLGKNLKELTSAESTNWSEVLSDMSVIAFDVTLAGEERATDASLVLTGPPGWFPSPADEEVVASLTGQAVLAFELASVRSERDRLLISADRERIARDLHDLVIQRLFGAGLRLQGVLGAIPNQGAAARVSSTIDDLDTTIKEIREAIFALESAPGTGFSAKVFERVAEAAEALGFKPSVSLHGEAEIPMPVQVEANAVLREALSNAARHSQATRVDVVVTVDDELAVLVVDNGVGVGTPSRTSGIANARARAELLGGHLDITPAEGGGTRFYWRVPLPAQSAD